MDATGIILSESSKQTDSVTFYSNKYNPISSKYVHPVSVMMTLLQILSDVDVDATKTVCYKWKEKKFEDYINWNSYWNVGILEKIKSLFLMNFHYAVHEFAN